MEGSWTEILVVCEVADELAAASTLPAGNADTAVNNDNDSAMAFLKKPQFWNRFFILTPFLFDLICSFNYIIYYYLTIYNTQV